MRVLFISHRIPYPPDKGERVRTFHQLRAIGARHQVDLFCLAHSLEEVGNAAHLRPYCEQIKVSRINPRLAKVRALSYLPTSVPLSLPCFYSAELAAEIARALRARSYDRIFVSCSSMAQYVNRQKKVPILMDFVDVDSDKWRQFAGVSRFPLSAIYNREAKCLSAFERDICGSVSGAIVTTEREAKLLRQISEAAPIHVLPIGVDTAQFARPSEISDRTPRAIVFTGDMSYLPNVDAAVRFAREVLPRVRKEVEDARFIIVGRNPASSVRALAKLPGVEVTGYVQDVRVYLARARLAVAPFTLASGIQTKVLEAMSFSLPVVATSLAIRGLSKVAAQIVETGETHDELASKTIALLQDLKLARQKGREGRDCVVSEYSWDRSLPQLLHLLENLPAKVSGTPAHDGTFRAAAAVGSGLQ